MSVDAEATCYCTPDPMEVACPSLARVHMDYAEKDGVYFLVVVDAHSKWPEVFSTSSTTIHKTIEMLSHLFGDYGLPEEIVSDNGPQCLTRCFTS